MQDYDERSLHGGLPSLGRHPSRGALDPRGRGGLRAAAAVLRRPDGRGDLDQRAEQGLRRAWRRRELTPTILTADEVRDLVERMLKTSGSPGRPQQPFVDATLPDGSRLHVVIPDISRPHWQVNIRKFVVKADHLDDLVRLGTMTKQAARSSRQPSRAGSTSSSPAAPRPARRRCSTASRRDPRPGAGGHLRGGLRARRSRCRDVVSMQSRQPNLEGTGEIPLRRLVKEALRMRPSRIIVGEVRQEECLDLLIALNSGLPGMCTVHANSAREAVTKMCTLPLLAGENVSSGSSSRPSPAVDLVIHVALERDGQRRVREIVAVPGVPRATSSRSPTSSSRDGGCCRARRVPAAPRGLRARRLRPAALLSRGALMSPLVIGLVLGAGVFCIYWSFWPQSRRRPVRPSAPVSRPSVTT